MRISAQIHNREGRHEVRLTTNDQPRSLTIPPKPTGYGSSANGGELLFLALTTCYCNDIYREAGKRGISVERGEVEVEGEVGGEGEPAQRIEYRARVTADASEDEIEALLRHTDSVAEIQNTIRSAIPIELASIEAISKQLGSSVATSG